MLDNEVPTIAKCKYIRKDNVKVDEWIYKKK